MFNCSFTALILRKAAKITDVKISYVTPDNGTISIIHNRSGKLRHPLPPACPNNRRVLIKAFVEHKSLEELSL